MNLDTMKAELMRDEGYRSRAYQCTAGKWTIGYGHLLEGRVSASELEHYRKIGITLGQAEEWLDKDLQQAIYDAQSFFPKLFELSEARQRVLVNMAFNLGLGGLMKFKQFRAMLEAKDYSRAAAAMVDSRWYWQVKGRAERLVEMMRNG